MKRIAISVDKLRLTLVFPFSYSKLKLDIEKINK
jgi:hypothetical protein